MSSGWAPGRAFMELVEARERAMPLTNPMTRRHEELTEGEILGRLAASHDTRERRALGLILARLLCEEAIVLESEEKVDDALFRLAHHYRESFTDPTQPGNRRQALRAAALKCFGALRSPPRGVITALRAGKTTAPGDAGWKEATGLTGPEFEERLEVAVGGKRAPTVDQSDATPALPQWVRLPPLQLGNPFISALANWTKEEREGDVRDLVEALRVAWHQFEGGDYDEAYESVEPVRASVDATWAPSGEVDALAFWHWMRLLVALYQSRSGEHRRRAALGAFELLIRVPIELPKLSDVLQSVVLDGFRPSDPGSEREWAILTARLAQLVGHEAIMSKFGREDRALLRGLWFRHLRSLDLAEDDSTHDMVRQIDFSLRGIRTRSQHLQTDQDVDLSRYLGEGIKQMRDFCDAYEVQLLDDVESLVTEFRALETLEPRETGITVLEAREHQLDKMTAEIRNSGSLMLQEAFLPAFELLRVRLADRFAELESVAQPELSLKLLSRRFPLQAMDSYEFNIDVAISNNGDTVAREVKATLEAENLTVTANEMSLGDLSPGSEKTVSFRALSGSGGSAQSLDLTLTWMDDLERVFTKTLREHAEAQRPSQWRPEDANPFQLGSIDDPDRLIGRESELQNLVDLVRAQGSTYVTGHKRVGKTSLVKVLLAILHGRGFTTAMLPLGRAFGGRASAGDLVLGMLDSLRQAIIRMRPDVDLHEIDEAAFQSNFALAAGRWLDATKASVSPEIRAVIAVDDFDELPLELVDGPEADALFLFLRTLVDESWLSLIFIGSEVLPTLIRGQGYKLNQVTETRVGRFTSRSDTMELLRVPTAERLDWDDSAIDAIHSACAGNPYYGTLTGQIIWQRMRDQDRTYVLLSDAETAVDAIAETADARHFMHYWTDDPEGMDPGSERARHSSAILRAVAKSTAIAGQRVASSDAIATAKTWVPGVRAGELGERLRTLLNRQVLEGSDIESVSIAVPMLAQWLRRAGGRYLDSDYALSAEAKANQYVVTSGEIVSLAERLYYCGERINEVQMQAWLAQFDGSRDRWLAFRLLHRLVTEGYFSAERLSREAMPALTRNIRQTPAGQHQVLGAYKKGERVYLENWYILDREISGSSADAIARSLSANLKIKKASNILTSKKLIQAIASDDEVSVVLIVDDFAGTGHQLEEATRGLIEDLGRAIPNWRERAVLVAGACVGSNANVLDGVREDGVKTALGIVVEDRLRAFDLDSRIFESDEDLREAQDLFLSIGESIAPSFPLGYGSDGLLALFEENCPNNTLPPFWANGEYRGEPWTPLFVRRW